MSSPVSAGQPTADSPAQSNESEDQEPVTRADELRARRQARLDEVEPAEPSAVAGLLATMENDGFDQLVTVQQEHFRFGFGKISPVSGATPAIQYERPRIGQSPFTLRMAAAYSVRKYQAYDLQLGVFDTPAPYAFSKSMFVGAPFEFDNRSVAPLDSFLYLDAHFRTFPEEEFFGIGSDSSNAARSDYHVQDQVLDVVAGHQFARWLSVQTRIGHTTIDITGGNLDQFPNTQDLFDDTSAPGLSPRTQYFHLETSLALAFEGDPGLPAAELELKYAQFDDLDESRFDFNHISADARGFVPLGSRQRTLAARAFVSRDRAASGSEVPFYYMQTLGGQDTLRGYRNFRFRDANVLFMSAEYRWEAAAGIDLALFYDAGKVFPDQSTFNFNNLRNTYGFGIRGKSLRRVVFRLDVGRSDEGTRLFIAFSPAF